MASDRQRRVAAETARRNFRTHGYSNHPLYETHRTMMRRCHEDSSYYVYGIDVCEEFQDVGYFCDWVDANLGPRPPGCTLDRIDNDRGYEPGNLRWADAKTQANNRGHGTLLEWRAHAFKERFLCFCTVDCSVTGACPIYDEMGLTPDEVFAAVLDYDREMAERRARS